MLMPRLTSITSQQLTAVATPIDGGSAPGPGSWQDDNGDNVVVSSIVSPTALQVTGVFATDPLVPFIIQGTSTSQIATVTNISANTGTVLELDISNFNPDPQAFAPGESLNILGS